MSSTRVLFRIAALVTAAAFASGVAAAGDEEQPAQTPVKITIQVAPGDAFRATYSEVVELDESLKSFEHRNIVETHWEMAFTAREDSSRTKVAFDVELLRISGRFASESSVSDYAADFDSRRGRVVSSIPSARLRRPVDALVNAGGSRGIVTVKRDGTIVAVEGDIRCLDDDSETEKARDQRLAAFFERFFQALPYRSVRDGAAWSAHRWAAPHLVVRRLRLLGTAKETYRVEELTPEILRAAIGGKGTSPGTRAHDDGFVRLALKKWELTGDVTVDAVTGLPRTRATRMESTVQESVRIGRETIRKDATYDYRTELRVERVESAADDE